MATARITQGVSRSDGTSYAAGEEVTGQVAHDAVAGGWGELVREQVPEAPEVNRARRQARPERRGQ